jgi:hypothetical protein
MIKQAQSNLGVKRMNVLADKEYHTGDQLGQCENLGIDTYVSPKASAVNHRFNVFPMDIFKDHPWTDTYRCPNNSIMRSNGKTYHGKG